MLRLKNRLLGSRLDIDDVKNEIRHVHRKFKRACRQVVLLNNRLEQLLVHYNRAGRDRRRSLRYARRLQIATIEGVRNMFYEYAAHQCQVMDDLQDVHQDLTGMDYESDEMQE